MEEELTIQEMADSLIKLAEDVKADVVKDGNKQAARRARKNLNEIKKICTPMRKAIQDGVKG